MVVSLLTLRDFYAKIKRYKNIITILDTLKFQNRVNKIIMLKNKLNPILICQLMYYNA